MFSPRMWHFGDSLEVPFELNDVSNLKSMAEEIAFECRERKKKVKTILLTTTALIALGIAPAAAADLAARPYTKAPPMVAMYDWSGFYIGANGGWGSSRNCWDATTALGVVLPATLAEGCHDSTGGTAGGQIGYRWQASQWVFGLEAQGNWADFSGSNVSTAFVPVVTNRTRIDAFGLFTGQVGYAWNNALLYVKGGAAVTSNDYTGFNAAGVAFDTASDTRWGATVGVGLEYGFAPNWSVGVEYNHLFMDDRNISMVSNGAAGPVGVVTRIDRISQDVDMVTARINYRFGGPVVARY
jgi:outer membrane immunogenic protein